MEQATSTYTIKIQNFEGPLDLLFHLIEKNKMDIYDIRIAEITEQYMEYLNKMKELDLEIASEFLIMASTLLLIKSRMLLPENNKSDDEQENVEDDLVSRLIEYKKYKGLAKDMKEREKFYSQIFYKPHEVFKIIPANIVNKNYSSELIPTLYRNICERNLRKINPDNTVIENLVVREKVTIRSKIREIIKELFSKAQFKFSELFSLGKSSRLEIATAFMALLELAKVKRITIEQKKLFGEITIRKLDKKIKEQ